MEAAPLRKERNPVAGLFSCSSKNRSSGALNAPWTQTMATPTKSAEIRSDPTLVRKTTNTLRPINPQRVWVSENVWPKMTSG